MQHLISRFFVQWSDCDAGGKVFYPNFYIWFDRASERLFRANRASFADAEREYGVIGMPLVETGADYEHPCSHGDELEMDTWVDAWEGRTYVVRHHVRHADGTLALTGFERRAWVEAAPETARGMRAVAVPDEVIARFTDGD